MWAIRFIEQLATVRGPFRLVVCARPLTGSPHRANSFMQNSVSRRTVSAHPACGSTRAPACARDPDAMHHLGCRRQGSRFTRSIDLARHPGTYFNASGPRICSPPHRQKRVRLLRPQGLHQSLTRLITIHNVSVACIPICGKNLLPALECY